MHMNQAKSTAIYWTTFRNRVKVRKRWICEDKQCYGMYIWLSWITSLHSWYSIKIWVQFKFPITFTFIGKTKKTHYITFNTPRVINNNTDRCNSYVGGKKKLVLSGFEFASLASTVLATIWSFSINHVTVTCYHSRIQ